LLSNLSPFAAILILATLVEALIEHLVKPLFFPADSDAEEPAAGDENGGGDLIHLSANARALMLRYTSALVGMLLCYAYDADLLALMGLHSAAPWIGSLVTGFLVGRGANFLHDFAGRWVVPLEKGGRS
jgi:hypothetical protein